MSENESMNCKIEQNSWQELRRTMECISDQPFQIIFIKGNASNNYFYPQTEITQSENTTHLNSTSSPNLKTASDGYGENNQNMSEKEKIKKVPLCNRARHLQSNNIAQLDNIFTTDAKKTTELSSHCKEVINRELMFWHDRIQFEMKQTNAIMTNLYTRMKRIRRLNRELRDLLAYFKDDTDSSITLST
ncbi:ECF RNA polymerase sigma factor SigH [Dirofilaria immitis]